MNEEDRLRLAIQEVRVLHRATRTGQGTAYCYACRGQYEEDVRYPCPTELAIRSALPRV